MPRAVRASGPRARPTQPLGAAARGTGRPRCACPLPRRSSPPKCGEGRRLQPGTRFRSRSTHGTPATRRIWATRSMSGDTPRSARGPAPPCVSGKRRSAATVTQVVLSSALRRCEFSLADPDDVREVRPRRRSTSRTSGFRQRRSRIQSDQSTCGCRGRRRYAARRPSWLRRTSRGGSRGSRRR